MSRAVWLLTALALGACDRPGREPTIVQASGIEIRAVGEPAAFRVGQNRIWIDLHDAAGQPIESAHVEVSVQMHAMGAMPAMGGPAAVVEVGGGRYGAAFDLDMGSTWQVRIRVTPPSGVTARAEGALTVGTPGLRLEAVGGQRGSPARPVPVTEDSDEHPAGFEIDPSRLQRIGVKSVLVQEREIDFTVRAVGRVVIDETGLADVSLKVRGWVGKLEVNAVGDPVEKGQVLFTLYSPELYAAQEEYLHALRSQERARQTEAPERADYLVRAARSRLRLWDIAPRDLDGIARRGHAIEQLPIRAPQSGFVIEKNLVKGSAIEPGQRLYRIAALDRVWIEADVYESEIAYVRPGQPAIVTFPYRPGLRFEGTVAYVYPTLSGDTRTARLRIELPNTDLELRPDMYANVELTLDRGRRLVVPQSAVLYTGDRSFVFLELGAGRFRPRQVEVGMRGGAQVEILSGLKAGDRVVASGTFLIASESRLRAALEQW